MSERAYNDMSDAEKKKEDWMNAKWRPMMGWMYMAVCMCDFVLFPVLWSIVQVHGGGEVKMQWNPITLQGAGLFHMAMGAVLGLAAWGRTQEKLGGANNGGLAPVSQSVTTTYGSSTAGGFGAPSAPSFGAPSAPSSTGGSSFGSAPSASPSFGGGSFNAPKPTTSSTGKPMPVQPEMPEL